MSCWKFDKSATLYKYKAAMKECLSLYYPANVLSDTEMDNFINYSINKRLVNSNSTIHNSYTNRNNDYNKDEHQGLLKVADYVMSRKPIVTAFGTMFQKHGVVPNPLFETVQSFLDLRGIHKKQMYKYAKGSEEFEKYNLAQTLT